MLLCEFMSACLLIKAAGKPAVTKGTFPSNLFQYIPSISARYFGLKKPNSSRFTFLLLSVSLLSLLLNCLGKDSLDKMLPLDENLKYSANTVECHVEHIWKQFVCEAELVCPQSCFLLKCLRAHCPHFLQLAFLSRQMLAPVTALPPAPCPPAKMADPSTEAQQAAVGVTGYGGTPSSSGLVGGRRPGESRLLCSVSLPPSVPLASELHRESECTCLLSSEK